MRKNKTWEITLTDNARLVANEPIENAVVYTTDTEAYLNFRVIDSGFEFDSATIAMLNKDDGSIVERPMTKEDGTAVYEIESDIIPHFGLWQAQVLFKQGEEIFTSTPVTFVIERYMMAEQPPRLEDVTNWKRLYDNATETIQELTRVNDELTTTNETVQQAEAQRVLAENERSEKYGSYAQQFNDVITDLSEEKDYHSLPEISAARGGHDTLGQRLDETTAQLAETVLKGSIYLNIVDYGARSILDSGFEGFDSTSAIQSALNDAVGKTVLIPSGTFKITTTLIVPQGVSILGVGSSSILRPQSCDALSFANSNGIGPVSISNFWIYGNGCDTYTAIRVPGDKDGNRVTGVSFSNIYISWYGTGMHFRALWHSSIRDCIFNNVYAGIKLIGQNVKVVIDGNKIVRGSSLLVNGETHSRGLVVDSAFDYGVNENVEKRPENVQVKNNIIFGYDIAVDHQRCLFSNYKDNDFDYCYFIGFRYQLSDGNLSIENNWIAVYDNATNGILATGLAKSNTDSVSIKGNKITGTNLLAGSDGIKLLHGQSNVIIEGNSIKGFVASDIRIDNARNVKISKNSCLSIGSGSSIYLISTKLMVSVSENEVSRPIYCHPTTNQRVDFGYNYGYQSTLLEGDATLLAETTTVSVAYSALPGAPPHFINGVTSNLPAKLVSIQSPSNVGNLWGTATNTHVTINVETAPTVDTKIRWVVKAFPVNG